MASRLEWAARDFLSAWDHQNSGLSGSDLLMALGRSGRAIKNLREAVAELEPKRIWRVTGLDSTGLERELFSAFSSRAADDYAHEMADAYFLVGVHPPEGEHLMSKTIQKFIGRIPNVRQEPITFNADGGAYDAVVDFTGGKDNE